MGCGLGTLPEKLELLEPGPVLAAFLATLTNQDLSGFDRIRVLQAHQRLVSHFQAQVCESMASISRLMNQIDADPEIAYESAAAEIGAALRLTRRAA
ncbi:MAG TPA: hypothetical protein VJQ79_08190, partial [Acidimicrobiia bacterium]|nr:hypothetical protein [Acidimicrobiia bacterium]